MRKTAPQRLAEREARARSELLDGLFSHPPLVVGGAERFDVVQIRQRNNMLAQ